MSLINKMLQDLDARGGSAGRDPLLVRPVVRPERQLVPRVALAVGFVAILAVGGWFSWRTLHQLKAAPPVAPARGPMPLAPVPPGMVRVIPPVVTQPPAPMPVEEVAPVVAAPAPPVHVAEAAVQRPRRAAPANVAAPAVHEPAPAPRNAEAEYRRALADLADGRVTEAIAALERTLEIAPRHDSARQVLVGLLVEAKRNDDAMRQLRLGLGLDPRQPALAMLLARLQLERGDAGAVDTLLRTLPYATGNGDYQAFLAGVLQRQGRNREAVAHYQAALAATPGNPVWLMGLGIALQAEQRDADALAAFQRAGASGTLPAELQAFVERKIVQLSR